MITFLRGTLAELLPMLAIIDVNGVGYEVAIPLSTYDRLNASAMAEAEVKLLTQLVIREDAHTLFGFATEEERNLFRLLVHNVTGVGPKMALGILSGITAADFRQAVVAEDAVRLSRIKGVGKKTAERIIIELRDKVGVFQAWHAAATQKPISKAEQMANDALLGLLALGFKQAEASKAVAEVQKKSPDATVEVVLRDALRLLG
ncbi:MAG: Holliday junction branch migration protein RuvA [Candidatus Methylacidiphilales bacterium]|nr:Holliday junction branch migration protein RuvA [Candidatus Methylacidiphilales bacterium]